MFKKKNQSISFLSQNMISNKLLYIENNINFFLYRRQVSYTILRFQNVPSLDIILASSHGYNNKLCIGFGFLEKKKKIFSFKSPSFVL